MAGLVPAIHVLFDFAHRKKDVDARHRAGHAEAKTDTAGMTRRLSVPWFVVLPLLLLALWHFAVDLHWLTEGIIPSPEQVLRSWYIWIFGGSKAMLSPYSGTWLDNV